MDLHLVHSSFRSSFCSKVEFQSMNVNSLMGWMRLELKKSSEG